MEKIFTDEIILDIYEEGLFDKLSRSNLSQKLKIEKLLGLKMKDSNLRLSA